MILELRWIERTEPVAYDPRIGTTVRVLQYRSFDEWRDVPELSAPSTTRAGKESK